MTNLTDLKEWHALAKHQKSLAQTHMRDLHVQNADRFYQFSLESCGILLDFSRNLITQQTLDLLLALANARELKEKIQAQFSGVPINTTEKRPALHTALRDRTDNPIYVNGNNVKTQIHATLAKMRSFVEQVHQHHYVGVTGKPIKYIVNIGIGGSYTGPKMCNFALKEFATSDLQFHFLSTIDKVQLEDVLKEINAEETLFIISSKSFTTIETLTNTKSILQWMQQKLGPDVISKHFIAITAASAKAAALGIPQDHIFPLWEWVGGRYSVWSAIGLPVMLLLGPAQFDEFLDGAHAMDQHVLEADFAHNLPVILALLGIWYVNFFDAHVQAIIPYAHRLRYLIAYLQQADMESNGKGVDSLGKEPAYTTGPVLFGEEGVIGQHAYHQLLHQGKHFIPADFIVVGEKQNAHHDVLLASALSQAQALMHGKTWAQARAELLGRNMPEPIASDLAQHQAIPGNKPTNLICLHRLTPRTLGSLIALYEHKIFIQGTIWGINSFDQWGVELGKQLLPDILEHLQGQENPSLDGATRELINHLRAGFSSCED